MKMVAGGGSAKVDSVLPAERKHQGGKEIVIVLCLLIKVETNLVTFAQMDCQLPRLLAPRFIAVLLPTLMVFLV